MARQTVTINRQLLRQRRLHMRLDQRDLGAAVGVSSRWISFLEGGRRSPSVALTKRLEAVLGARLDVPQTDVGDHDTPRMLRLRARDAELSEAITSAWRERAAVREEMGIATAVAAPSALSD